MDGRLNLLSPKRGPVGSRGGGQRGPSMRRSGSEECHVAFHPVPYWLPVEALRRVPDTTDPLRYAYLSSARMGCCGHRSPRPYKERCDREPRGPSGRTHQGTLTGCTGSRIIGSRMGWGPMSMGPKGRCWAIAQTPALAVYASTYSYCTCCAHANIPILTCRLD